MKVKRSFLHLVGLFVCAVYGSANAATSNPILQQSNMSLALANQLINATLAACHADNRSAVVTVVDRGGNLIAVQRDDQVGPHNTGAAQLKAFTALSTKTPTRLLAERARTTPDSQNLATLDSLLLIGGGVPVFSGKEIIGAIGVGGAGGAAQDESCALQAIQQILPTSN
ncbi:heme-binding protein [Iodobacter sp. HSC-16F04]|uniref:Heme-binding protein n=1 Tax=Iodobacter violaceini TaxID=3044271 RepID=A0ABX0KZF5_9NEIS|nr:heme-binding protein [Iodobacter violacea]NHQ86476.1 heme-binding protein [Iodobacter violacea]